MKMGSKANNKEDSVGNALEFAVQARPVWNLRQMLAGNAEVGDEP